MALVFVSCGQANDEERATAHSVREWLETQGFEVFVALETQSLSDINSGTIGHLRRADYYLFIDFPRERLVRWDGTHGDCRGSLFTHQELAIAYVMDFPDAVFLKHRDCERHGLAKFMMANATHFDSSEQVLPRVQELITQRGWHSAYTRNLRVTRVWGRGFPIYYRCHNCERWEYIYHAEIEHGRSDRTALNVVSRLTSITTDAGANCNVDHSRLKWAGEKNAYDTVIFPKSVAQLDLFALDRDAPQRVYLHSMCDIGPQRPIIETPGEYRFDYEVAAVDFLIHAFAVRLTVTGDSATTTVKLVVDE